MPKDISFYCCRTLVQVLEFEISRLQTWNYASQIALAIDGENDDLITKLLNSIDDQILIETQIPIFGSLPKERIAKYDELLF